MPRYVIFASIKMTKDEEFMLMIKRGINSASFQELIA